MSTNQPEPRSLDQLELTPELIAELADQVAITLEPGEIERRIAELAPLVAWLTELEQLLARLVEEQEQDQRQRDRTSSKVRDRDGGRGDASHKPNDPKPERDVAGRGNVLRSDVERSGLSLEQLEIVLPNRDEDGFVVIPRVVV
jgi:Asp-tRNA(Asn)/Glu-tRNA(Gln) amidotransferase C subunit